MPVKAKEAKARQKDGETGRVTRRRASPKNRLPNMGKLVFETPIPLPDAWIDLVIKNATRLPKQSGHLDERKTPLAQMMVDAIPIDGCWYLAAITYSHGEANALASHINRGGYAHDLQVAYDKIVNLNKRGLGREHWVFVRRLP